MYSCRKILDQSHINIEEVRVKQNIKNNRLFPKLYKVGNIADSGLSREEQKNFPEWG